MEPDGEEKDEEEDVADPRTRPWPLKAEEEEEKGLLTFLIRQARRKKRYAACLRL